MEMPKTSSNSTKSRETRMDEIATALVDFIKESNVGSRTGALMAVKMQYPVF